MFKYICETVLHDKLRWSHQTVTCVAQKTPPDWKNQCGDAAQHVSFAVTFSNTPPEAILNGDQTGVKPIPLSKYMWAPQGAKLVDSFGKEEKWQFTLMVMMSCTGDIFPMQC